MGIFSRITNFYKTQFNNMVGYCTKLDKRKTAFAIALAICVGITPLFGLTFLLVTSFGLIFKLNQFILQSVHIMVSPLQILFFYPFMRTGKFVFGLHNEMQIPVKQIAYYIYNHTGDFLNQYLKIFMAGIVVWIMFSIFMGYIIFRIILMYLYGYQKVKIQDTGSP